MESITGAKDIVWVRNLPYIHYKYLRYIQNYESLECVLNYH